MRKLQLEAIRVLTDEQAYSGPLPGAVAAMPRIPDDMTYGISFTYRTRAEAVANARVGGTAFLIGKPVPGVLTAFGGATYMVYAVTNYHVAWGGTPVLRMHRRDELLHPIELTQADWVPHPNGDDLAIAFLSDRMALPGESGQQAMNAIKFVPTTKLVTEDMVRAENIGFGDEVFMIGRFLNHQGTKDALAPAVRLGNISMMPQPIWNSVTNSNQESFAVEMRSRTGFSGSPVAVYRENVKVNGPRGPETWWWMLGVNWGFINEKDTGENTWLNGVIPAWKILELLEEPALRDKHQAGTDYLKGLARGESPTSTPAIAFPDEDTPSNDANPNHLKDFTRLVDVAARKRPQGDQT